MAFPTKKLISLLIAIVSALTPVIYSLVNNAFPNSPNLKVSFYLHPMESSINSPNPMRRRRDTSRDYVNVLQAKIEKELFGESHKGRNRLTREDKDLRRYSQKIEKPEKLGVDAECKLVNTDRNKKMFQCTGPNKGPLSSMIFEFTK